MAKVISTVPKARFMKYGVSFSKDWDVQYLTAPYTDEELLSATVNADYLFVCSTDRVSANVINGCKSLKMIQTEGVSFDKVDIQAAKEKGIPVCNNKAVNKTAVAEHAVGMILAGIKRIAYLDRSIHQVGYQAADAKFIAEGGHEIGGLRIGLLGMGAIGKEAVKRLAPWNCDLCYYDPFRMTGEQEKELNVTFLEQDELFATSDVISIHVPVTPSTTHMINRESLQKMKPNALIVNVARGEIINNEDLVWALENDVIYGAALDTICPEPLPDDHPLMTLSPKAAAKLTMTTHVAGRTNEAFERMLHWSVANFERAEKGETLVNVVNAK